MDHADNKNKVARVFVPVFCPEGETAEQMAAAGRFSSVISVLCNLCKHDEDWLVYVTEARIQGRRLRKTPRGVSANFNVLECDIPKSVDLIDFLNEVTVQVLNEEYGSDWCLVEELIEWNRKMKVKPKRSTENEYENSLQNKLYYFNSKISKNLISDEILSFAQEFLPEDYFLTFADKTKNVFEAIVAHYNSNNNKFPPYRYKEQGAGSALSTARQGKNKALIALLNAEFGDAWEVKRNCNANAQFEAIVAYFNANNNKFPPQSYKEQSAGLALMTARVGKNKALIALLDAEFGDTWKRCESNAKAQFEAIVAYFNANNNKFPPRNYKEQGAGAALGNARISKNKALAALLDAKFGNQWLISRQNPEGIRKFD
jgi:hypothetical protein